MRAAALTFAAAVAVEISTTAQAPVSSPLNKHNLSAKGPGPIRASDAKETEICIFCHAPHNANPAAPLWNHAESGVTYTPYSSSTMAAAPGAPTGSAKLCLSCHDGTVAVGATLTRATRLLTGVNAAGQMTGASALGTSLSDDHPISFAPVTGAQLVNPAPGDPVKLDPHGMLQCRTCHDPHQQDIDPVTKKFLVKANGQSALCLTCHQKTYWATSSHRTSTSSFTAAQGAHTGYTTVSSNGCESCHKPHTAPNASRMLKDVEEKTCTTCHGSSGVASTNIAAAFNKSYRHPAYVTPSAHDASESPDASRFSLPEVSSTTSRHAECVDCHNPHASHANATTAPKASGRLAGVWGIDINGAAVQPSGTPPSVQEYEICFKCHADSANKPQPSAPSPPYPNRQLAQFNKRLQFDPSNPSFHPVAARGRSSSVPSLIAPWTTSSIMYCTDCHDNDTGPNAPSPGSGPAGPHGSNYKHLLVARYEIDNSSQPESASAYALCYKCHSRTSILGDESFKEHSRHIIDAGAPCSICHDPHGISATQGTSANNSRLINFDRRFVTPSRSGLLRFEVTGTGRGQCYLTCHGKEHDPRGY